MEPPAVGNRLFTDDQLRILLAPQRWRWVSARFGSEVKPQACAGHRRWMKHHTHCHAYAEVLLVLNGAGRYGLNGAIYPLRRGTVILFYPHDRHDLGYPAHSGPAEHLWLGLVQDRCFAFLLRAERGDRVMRRVWMRSYALNELDIPPNTWATLFHRTGSRPAQTEKVRASAAVSVVVAALVERGNAEVGRAPEGPLAAQVIETIRRHIHAAGGRECRLDSLARLSGYSKYHLLRLFHRHTGMRVHAFINECRQEQEQKLRAMGYTGKAISEALGFRHPSAYSRWRRQRRVGARAT